jgi:hypothetical protein
MKTIPVATFNGRRQAEPLQKRLAASGIQAEIRDELRHARLWFVSRPEIGVRLEAPAAQCERAHQLLHAWDTTEGALREAIRCPECGSLRVDYPQYTEKSLLTNLAMGLAAELRLIVKECYCRDCQYTWPKGGSKHSRLRPHMAPYYFIEGIEQSHGRGPHQETHRKAA